MHSGLSITGTWRTEECRGGGGPLVALYQKGCFTCLVPPRLLVACSHLIHGACVRDAWVHGQQLCHCLLSHFILALLSVLAYRVSIACMSSLAGHHYTSMYNVLDGYSHIRSPRYLVGLGCSTSTFCCVFLPQPSTGAQDCERP
jgi:hypothetical protein